MVQIPARGARRDPRPADPGVSRPRDARPAGTAVRRGLPRAPAPVLAILALLALAGDAGASTPTPIGGVTVDGGRLGFAVNGADAAGSFQARFSDSTAELFYDQEGASFGVQTGGGAYSARRSTAGGVARDVRELTPPVLAGSGTAANPWTVTSSWRPDPSDGGPDLRIEQVARHVAGRSSVAFTWTVTNRTGVALPFRASLAGDLYVRGSDFGTGVLHDGPPREVGGVAEDGTEAVIVEGTPWTRRFTGFYIPAVAGLVSGTALLEDRIDPTAVDNGVGVQWADHDEAAPLAPGATATYTATWRFAPPGTAPAAPLIGSGPAEGGTSGPATTFELESPVLAGGGRLECSLDGDAWAPCPARHVLDGLAEGRHELRVRAFDEEERVGAVTTRTWTVVGRIPDDETEAPGDPGPTTTTATGGITTTTTTAPPPLSVTREPKVREPCASRRTLVSRIPRRVGRVTRAEVVLGKGRVRRLRVGSSGRVQIDLRGLRAARYTVRIRVRTPTGRIRVIERSFRTCVRPGGGVSAR